MISNKYLLALLLIFSLSCENEDPTTIDFPVLKINKFIAAEMELETNNVSYILNATNLSPISLRLSWAPINRVDFNKINVYRISENTATLIKEIDDIEKQSTTIDTDLTYENEEQFQLTVVHEDGEESPLSFSNKVGINITFAEPDNYNFTYNADTLSAVTIEWLSSGNGLTNPIVNVDAVRNNLLDSISINVLYKKNEFDNYKKVFSAIGHYQNFAEELSLGQGADKKYKIDINILKTKIFDNFVQVILADNDFLANASIDDPYKNLFKVDGFYEIFFYFYKRINGRLFIYKSSLTETIKFPK